MRELAFEERFGLLVDVEYSIRKNNCLKSLSHNAEFDPPSASIADIDYTSGCKFNKALIHRLAGFRYISDCHNIFITGATYSGKSYMACTLGIEACKHYYNTRYVRLPYLLPDLKTARENNCYKKTMARYTNPILLILDEWLLMKPSDEEQKDIFELLHRRRKKSSTIFCSQYKQERWYEQLGGGASPPAYAILDRIVHDSYIIDIIPVDPSKDLSMWEVYGLK